MKNRTATRRQFLGCGAVAGAAASGIGCSGEAELVTPPPANTVFRHGVASGDPLVDGIVLWTRVTPSQAGEVDVNWQVALDPEMREIVAQGKETTGPGRDFTVKVDVADLSPGTIYYYCFDALGAPSPRGRTKTSKLDGAGRARLGFVSCSSYAQGYFNVYQRLAQRDDLDLVVHLGDYIYEHASGIYGKRRVHDPPHAVVTLDDYRRRYRQYRTDPDLQAVHQAHPFVTIWDDHEFANNASITGAKGHGDGDGEWTDRRLAALQAYFEWMPIRDLPRGQTWRSVRYGNLVELFVLDARIWARETETETPTSGEEHTLLGVDQEAWLAHELGCSTANFKIVGQQVLMSQLKGFGNKDGWASYPEARQRLLDVLALDAVNDVIIVTGDVHASFAFDLTRDAFSEAYDQVTGVGSLAVELVVPPVTSPSFLDDQPDIFDDNPHLRFGDLDNRGYLLLDITTKRVDASWFYVDTVAKRDPEERLGGSIVVATGENAISRDAG